MRVLDATAGNRVVWRCKDPDGIIFLDLEKRLERKPTIFADNRCLPFRDKSFHTILFDPPHAWAFKSIFWGFPDRETFSRNHPNDPRQYPTYYGMERYRTKSALLKAIYEAQREFLRVLVDDGLLWFNWSELKMEANRILVLFDEWTELIRLRVVSPNQQLSDCTNYWIALAKARLQFQQVRISDLIQGVNVAL